MAEIFLGYILSFVDFTVKIAIIAFVAQQFGFITVPKVSTAKSSDSSSQDSTTKSRSTPQEESPMASLFKQAFEQMGPILSQVGKTGPKEGRPVVNFSDDSATPPPIAQAQVDSFVENLTTKAYTPVETDTHLN